MAKVFVLSGPSGAGKTSVMKLITERHPHRVSFVPSHTTRRARPGEAEGVDYYFTDQRVFSQLVAQNEFVAYKDVYREQYGTSSALLNRVLSGGRDALLILDPEGAEEVRKHTHYRPIFIFINPPSLEALSERIIAGGRNNIAERVHRAQYEVGQSKRYDYIIINDILEHTVREVEKIMELR